VRLTLTFSRRAAFALGIVLPLLETWRRRHQWGEIHLWPVILDDFFAGALLLSGALLTRRSPERGRPLLASAWGVVTAGMYYSFFGQLAAREPDPSGVSTAPILVVKGAIFALCLVGLVGALRGSIGPREG
jgi:hypothetical protein